MKRLFCLSVPALTLILSGCSSFPCQYFGMCEYAQNPDPNHIHADFEVWIENEEVDFGNAKYMSGVSYDDATHDEEGEYHHEHLHLHDNNGEVIHQHKTGYLIKDFFASLGFSITPRCFTMDTGDRFCTKEEKSWRMFVTNPSDDSPEWHEMPLNPNYEMHDMDQILLTYQTNGEEGERFIAQQKENMPDDACLYSRTCPWRGEPPAENCIADPEVPCVLPVE